MEKNNVIQVEEQNKNSWDEALENERWIAPETDIYETDEAFVMLLNMPGVAKENVKIRIEDDDLVIMGKIDYNARLNSRFVLNETEIGNFYRKFKIGEIIDDSRISAKLENGQLILTLPKHERAKPKTIEIR